MATKFNKVPCWALWIGDLINFSSTVECSPYKRDKKSSQKRCKSTKNCLTVDIAKDRSNTLKERGKKAKNEKKSNKSFFNFTILYRKIYISLENIFGKT